MRKVIFTAVLLVLGGLMAAATFTSAAEAAEADETPAACAAELDNAQTVMVCALELLRENPEDLEEAAKILRRLLYGGGNN